MEQQNSNENPKMKSSIPYETSRHGNTSACTIEASADNLNPAPDSKKESHFYGLPVILATATMPVKTLLLRKVTSLPESSRILV